MRAVSGGGKSVGFTQAKALRGKSGSRLAALVAVGPGSDHGQGRHQPCRRTLHAHVMGFHTYGRQKLVVADAGEHATRRFLEGEAGPSPLATETCGQSVSAARAFSANLASISIAVICPAGPTL